MVVILSSVKGSARRQDLARAAVKIPNPRNANTYCPNYCGAGRNRIAVFSVSANKPEQSCVSPVTFIFHWVNFSQWIRRTTFLFSAFKFSPCRGLGRTVPYLSSRQTLLASYRHQYHVEKDKVSDGARNLQVELSKWGFWILSSNHQQWFKYLRALLEARRQGCQKPKEVSRGKFRISWRHNFIT